MIFQNQILGVVRLTLLRYGLVVAACCAGVITAGCGQKGPLFLPTVPVAKTAPAAPLDPQTTAKPALPVSAAR